MLMGRAQGTSRALSRSSRRLVSSPRSVMDSISVPVLPLPEETGSRCRALPVARPTRAQRAGRGMGVVDQRSGRWEPAEVLAYSAASRRGYRPHREGPGGEAGCAMRPRNRERLPPWPKRSSGEAGAPRPQEDQRAGGQGRLRRHPHQPGQQYLAIRTRPATSQGWHRTPRLLRRLEHRRHGPRRPAASR